MGVESKLKLLGVVRSTKTSEAFLKARKQWPWLVSVSEDGHKWEIVDGSGERRKTKSVSLDVELLDGTSLANGRNKDFYDLVVDYAETFRLFNPGCTAAVHVGRIKALLSFLCWLSGYRIRSLKQVKREHFESYASHISYGAEVALGVPDKVFSSVKNAIIKKEDLPFRPSGKTFIRRGIHQMAGTRLIFDEKTTGTYTKSVLTWFESNIKNDFKGVDLGSVSFEDVLEEMDAIPTKVTVQDVHRKLLPIEEIWDWYGYMSSDSFDIVPYPIGTGKVAAQLGLSTKRTRSIPPKIAFEFLGEAVKWVLDYSDTIIELYSTKASPEVARQKLMDEGLNVEKITSGKSFASKVYGSVTLEALLRMLAGACFAVIAALTARRKEEILDLGAGCCDGPRDDGAFWLTIYIEKTTRRYDRCPVPSLVNKAVSVMESLSSGASDLSGRDTLWEYVKGDGTVSSCYVKDSIQDLYDFFVIDKTGVEWTFSPHQFRRFFALIYYYRYEGAYVGALSFHLRHFSIEMTKRYITDEHFMKAMNEVAEEWSASYLRGVLVGNKKIGGKGGEKIKKKFTDWKKQFRGKVDVVEREQIINKMTRYMARVGVNFQQHVWGTVCSCPTNTSLASQARCRNENNVPVLSNGAPELCGECPFSVYTERYAEGLSKDIDARRKTQEFVGKNTVVGELSGIQIVSLNNLMKKAETITAMSVIDS